MKQGRTSLDRETGPDPLSGTWRAEAEGSPTVRRRTRPTELDREVRRLTANVSSTLGDACRSARTRRRLTQQELAALVGVHQTWISRLELGHRADASLELWVAIGLVLGRPFAASLSKTIDPTQTVADAGHLEIQEHVLALARAIGIRGTFELPTRPTDPRRSTDVGLRDAARRTRILVECWNTFGDVGAAVRSTRRKSAEAAAAWPADRTASVWVVRESAANRAVISRYPNLFRSTFGGSSRGWVAALTTGAGAPTEPGLVWFDPSRARIHAWRAFG